MTGNELLRKLKRFSRKTNTAFEFDPSAGKVGMARSGWAIDTPCYDRHKEIPKGTLRAMLSQLGIDPRYI